MIVSKLKNDYEEQEFLYPALKIFKHKETENVVVVLFTERNTGTCLYNKNDPLKIGEVHDLYGEDQFELFEDELILRNKGE